MKNGLTLKNRIMLVTQSKDPKEIVEIQKYMRFRLNYTYDTMRDYFMKVTSISALDFDALMQIGDEWIDKLSNIQDA
jgi:hypothetical protein